MNRVHTVGNPWKPASERKHREWEAWGEGVDAAERRAATLRTFQRAALQSRRRDSADGLVIASYLSVAPDGRLVQLHLPGVAPKAPETRGEVKGFSPESKRRLDKLLNTIRRDAALPTMQTLTFPEEISVSPWEAKECRRAFAKRMRRLHPRWCALWRLEAHPEMSARLGRVHPHIHMLTWGAWYDLAEVSRVWTEVVWKVLQVDGGLCDAEGRLVREKHREAGTNCERVRKWEGVAYCAKRYIAKEEEVPLGRAGRVWGWDWRANLPLARVVRVPLSHSQTVGAIRAVERWMLERQIKSEHLMRCFFVEDPGRFAMELSGIPIPGRERGVIL